MNIYFDTSSSDISLQPQLLSQLTASKCKFRIINHSRQFEYQSNNGFLSVSFVRGKIKKKTFLLPFSYLFCTSVFSPGRRSNQYSKSSFVCWKAYYLVPGRKSTLHFFTAGEKIYFHSAAYRKVIGYFPP